MHYCHNKNNSTNATNTPQQNLLQKIPITRKFLLQAIPNYRQNSKSYLFKGKHRKYFSCESSPDSSPLLIRKEFLKDRKQQLLVPNFKSSRVRLKQKTQCFNYAYIKHLQSTKQTVDWVKYNIQLGIYALLGRIKKNFAIEFLQKKQFQTVKPELAKINKCILQIQKFSKFIPLNYFRFDKAASTFSEFKNIDNEVNKAFYKIQNKQKESNNKEALFHMITQNKAEIKKFKDAIKGLSSAFCMLSRKISIQKENQLIKQFFQQKNLSIKDQNVRHRTSISKLTMLFQVLEINKRRCSILNDLADRIQDVENYIKTMELNQEQIEKLQTLHFFKDLQSALENSKDQEISKISQSLLSILGGPSQQNLAKNESKMTKNILKSNKSSNEGNKVQMKKSVRIKTKERKNCGGRASIELLIDQIHSFMTKTESVAQEQKGKSKLTLNRPTNKELKLQIDDNELKGHFNQEKFNIKKLSKIKQKKALAFASELCEPEAVSMNRSYTKSSKSILSKNKYNKRIKQSSGIEFNLSNKFVSIKSFKSIKILKSMKSIHSIKSITSNGSYGSSKIHTHSQKARGKIKIFNGCLKKISRIRPYRSKIFKLNEQLFSQLDCLNSDLKNLPTQLQQQQQISDSQEFITSLNDIIKNRESAEAKQKRIPNIIQYQIKVSPGVKDNKYSVQTSSVFPQKTNEKTNQNIMVTNFHRKSKKAVKIISHNDVKTNTLRQFLSLFNEIKSGKNIFDKKKAFCQHFQKLNQKKLIPQALYKKYRQFLNQKQRKRREDIRGMKLTTEQEEHQSNKKNGNIYQGLINLRKNIQKNLRLNQINKYYYNFQQFKSQQERIEQTKQLKTVDQQFFYIKSYVDKKEPCIATKFRKKDVRYFSQDENLLQKEF